MNFEVSEQAKFDILNVDELASSVSSRDICPVISMSATFESELVILDPVQEKM